MTVNDEDAGHFAENCFAEDDDEASPAVKSDIKPESVVEEEIKVAINIDDETSSKASDQIQLEDWEHIEGNFYDLWGVHPPDIMTDPFKEKWTVTK